jgi:hypothetical protein
MAGGKKQADGLRAMFDNALEPMRAATQVHSGPEADALRACLASEGEASFAESWGASAVKIVESLAALRGEIDKAVAARDAAKNDADKNAAMSAMFRQLMDRLREISVATATWNRAMAADATMNAAVSTACVRHFARFLQRMFSTNADALEKMTSMGASKNTSTKKRSTKKKSSSV